MDKALSGHTKLMCARGLFMLCHLETLEDFNMFEVALQLSQTIIKMYGDIQVDRVIPLEEQEAIIQFLATSSAE